MASYLSAGVYIQEIDQSSTISVVSDSTAVFAGNFEKGAIGYPTLISSVQELKDHYGNPNKINYNEWYQCYNFLQYGNTLYISRAGNIDGYFVKTENEISQTSYKRDIISEFPVTGIVENSIEFKIPTTEFENIGLKELEFFKVNEDEFQILTIENLDDDGFVKLILDKPLELQTNQVIIQKITKNDVYSLDFNGLTDFKIGDKIKNQENSEDIFTITYLETKIKNNQNITTIDYINGDNPMGIDNLKELDTQNGEKIFIFKQLKSSTIEFGDDELDDSELPKTNHTVKNFNDFESEKSTLSFTSIKSKLKFFAKTAGSWGNDIEIAIANSSDFNKGIEVFNGYALDDLFEYSPKSNEIAVVVKYKDSIVERYTCSLDEDARDESNNSIFIENVINQKSSYILVKVNAASREKTINSYLNENSKKLIDGIDCEATNSDILDAYLVFDNKEESDVDIVIGNEKFQNGAIQLATQREDCIAFIGAPKDCSLGLKSSISVDKHLQYRKDLNLNNSFVALFSNYKYQYLPELDKYDWINLAGDVAGLKAQSNENRATWFAAAGLERGQIKNCSRLAVSFQKTHTDSLYKNGINPIVNFINQGIVLWGQKTLLDKSSAFNRINVRALFNYLERSLSKMSKYSLFEQNDSFLRNYITSTFKPFLASVKAGRGITDYLVICDETNNTAQVVANNQLIVDIYIKPTYSAEFILLRFTNSGANDFTTTIS